jgi:hypothetical protein
LVFCSNCGKELTGQKRYCNSCGYKISEDEYNLIKSTAVDKEGGGSTTADVEGKDADITSTPMAGDYKGNDHVPLGAKVKHKMPKSTTCVTCNVKTDDICYFCSYAVCQNHSLKMQIFADKSKFGNAVGSCAKCADRVNGKQPTKDEAEGIGFFFKIKPYHEWKILD